MAQARRRNAAAAAKRKSAEDRDLQALRDIADDVIESDFVPYACLYDPATLLTKNGELLHIIRITGSPPGSTPAVDVRAALRDAIARFIPDSSYAIWIHTQRRQQSLEQTATFPDDFSREVAQQWRAHYPSASAYANELSITLVKAGEDAAITDLPAVIRSLLPRSELARREAYIEQSQRALAAVTRDLLTALAPYGARLLTTVEREGVYYGEHLEFLEKIINLEERPMPLPRRDLSKVLTSGEVTFGFNAMEVRTAEGHRRFAAVMTVKEYKESILPAIDRFLEIPCELIVTQCFDFIGADRARESYEKQAEYLRISGDKELAQWMEIDRLSGDRAAGAMAFGQQQTSIFLIAPSIKQLESHVRMVQKSFARMGVVAVREDLRLEECYWAQLPGNFPFLSRQRAIDSHHLAGFANLPVKPLGNAAGSPWGAPITLLRTLNDAPYHFNFHRDAVAHSLLIGRDSAALAGCAHFLIAQTRKLPVSIWYLDGGGRSSASIRAMGGTVATPGTPSLRLNPLQLPDTPNNREFLAVWLTTLIDPLAQQLNQATLGFFQSVVAQLMQWPVAQRRLSQLLPMLRETDPLMARQFARWCAGGEWAEWFDAPTDAFHADALHSWDLTACTDDARRVPMASYLLHRLTAALNGKPTLIVLNDALPLLNTPLFSARVGAWLDFLSSRHAACMALTSTIAYASAYPYARVLSDKAASLMVQPDTEVDSEYMMAYGLQEADLGALTHLAQEPHQLLHKRGAEAMVIKLNLGVLHSLYTTLRGDVLNPTKTPKDILAELMGMPAEAGA